MGGPFIDIDIYVPGDIRNDGHLALARSEMGYRDTFLSEDLSESVNVSRALRDAYSFVRVQVCAVLNRCTTDKGEDIWIGADTKLWLRDTDRKIIVPPDHDVRSFELVCA